jgi:hypothetical protein
MFIAYAQRTAAQRVNEIKNAMVSGIWANTDFNEGNERSSALEKVEEFAANAIDSIYGDRHDEVEIDMDAPFFQAMKVPEVPQIDHHLVEE